MVVKGTLYVHNNTATGRIEVHAVTLGESPGILTHNMRATEAEAYNENGSPQHDDGQFGHSNTVPSGSDASPQDGMLSFPVGGTYHSEDLVGNSRIPRPVTIGPGTFLRVGFRQRAFTVVKIPGPGQIVEVPFEEMRPQTNSAMGRSQWANIYRFQGWNPQAMVRDGNHVPPQLKAMLAQKCPYKVEGQVRIVPVASESDPAKLAGWDVWYDNMAQGTPKPGETHGFTATVVLTNAEGKGEKNAGLGLESMPCPKGGTSARQRIVAGGDYGSQLGVIANPGCGVRLGIRGFSAGTTTLPSLQEGARVIDLRMLERTKTDAQSDWFDGDKLGAKLGEKKNRVDFFVNGQRINDQLPDTIYTGEEAFAKAEFKQPPKVVVRALAKGGWEVEVESLLPEADKLGPVGFTCKLSVEGQASAPSFLTAKNAKTAWTIPAGASGSLTVDTGPLGWRGTIPLPGPGQSFDSSEPANLLSAWVLRESDYLRAALSVVP